MERLSVIPLQGLPGQERPRRSPVGGCMAHLLCYLYLVQCSHVMSQSLLHKQTNKQTVLKFAKSKVQLIQDPYKALGSHTYKKI